MALIIDKSEKGNLAKGLQLTADNKFKPKYLLFAIPILLGLGAIFASFIGGMGLFPQNPQWQWITNMTDTIKNACGNGMLWSMMLTGAVGAAVGIGCGFFGLTYEVNKDRKELEQQR